MDNLSSLTEIVNIVNVYVDCRELKKTFEEVFMGNQENLVPEICNECDLGDRCLPTCLHLAKKLAAEEVQKGIPDTPVSLNYLKVKGGFSG